MVNEFVQTNRAVGAGQSTLDVCWQEGDTERDQLHGSPGCPAALKVPSAPLGSDSGEKSASPMMQQGTGEGLWQQGKISPLRDVWIITFFIIIYNPEHRGRWRTIIPPFPSSE